MLPKPPHSAKLSKTPGSVYRVYRVYRVLYTAAAMQPADQADPGPRTMAAAATLSYRKETKVLLCPLLRHSAGSKRSANHKHVLLLEKSSAFFKCCHCFQCIYVNFLLGENLSSFVSGNTSFIESSRNVYSSDTVKCALKV